MPRGRTTEIRDYIVENVTGNPSGIAAAVVRQFGITRAAANRHLRALIDDGILEAEGNTRSRKYRLRSLFHQTVSFPIIPDLREDKVWRDSFALAVASEPRNIVDICQYGFTEIFNNAIEHSGAESVTASMTLTAASVEMWIADHGVGIFQKIKADRGLDDERHAILELAKGKMTTDPAHHTGEGIFFSSRMFDEFVIASGLLYFIHREEGDDWLVEDHAHAHKGTAVKMCIATGSARTTTEVFDRYASGQYEYGFTRTHVPVTLVRYGDENLVSRSQAKRLVAGLDKFKEVLFDFEDVATIGQAFADEVFRIFRNEHPTVAVTWVNANEDVRRMIERAMGAISR